MADADEDAIGPGRATVDLDSADISDETQDFRFLSSLLNKSDQSTILKRGEKDFQSHGTRAQENVLKASRQAMHEALSVPRLHNPTSLIGYFDPDTNSSTIDEPKGNTIRNIGTNDSQNRLHLLPEECLYLLERGSLSLRYRDSELSDIPLSLQSAYAYLLGASSELSLERYIVYTGLKRSGYIIQRAPTFNARDHDRISRPSPPPIGPNTNPGLSLSQRLYNGICASPKSNKTPAIGPLVRPGLYRSYAPIYSQLSLIPFHDPTSTEDRALQCLRNYSPLRPVYHVWKPGAAFRKTAPPPPDFRICVLDARENDFPSLEQLDDLLQCMPYDPPPPQTEGKPYQRLRHGYRNVILAVVDQGIVSYVRVADAAFGCEPVWNRKARGGKGGGGGARGRGRGGGRGRGSGR